MAEAFLFLQAVRALDSGDLRQPGRLLDDRPAIIHYHCHYGEYEKGCFAGATLLHHIAGNPIRCPIRDNIVDVMRLSIPLENGCRATVQDSEWNGTVSGWAEHGGHTELAALLRRREAPSEPSQPF